MIIDYSYQDGKSTTFQTDADTVIIGRDTCADVEVDINLLFDEYVSHKHSRLTYAFEQYWVEDLGSANGTWVNGVLVARKTRLSKGDRVRVGWTRLIIQMPTQESAEKVENEPRTTLRYSKDISRTADPGVSEPGGGTANTAESDFSDDFEMDETMVTDGFDAAAYTPKTGRRPVVKETPKPPLSEMRTSSATAEVSAAAYAPKAGRRPVAKKTPKSSLPEMRPSTATAKVDAAAYTPKARRRHSVKKTPKPSMPEMRPSAVILAQADSGEQEDAEPLDDTCVREDIPVRKYTPPVSPAAAGAAPEVSRLRALSELSRLIGCADSFDSLMRVLEKNMPRVIASAQRGAVLLPDGKGKLLLKAHWPQGEPSVSMTWIKQAFEKQSAFVWSAPAEDETAGATPHSALFYKVQAAIYVPLVVGEEVLGVMYVDNFYSRNAFSEVDLELMKTMASQVAVFIKDRVLSREQDRQAGMQSVFERQFPPRIAQILAGKYSSQKVGGEKADPVTILVSDVRNFTALSAEMEPDGVVRMINEMFDALVPIIFEYDGVVDKFVGDSVLAVFGSPQPDDQQWEKAVRTALEMQKAIHKLGEGRRVRRLPVFEVGISVHSGEVIHGFIGSLQRTEYTVIGDAVNKAARFCDGAGPGEIVISEPVFEQVYSFVDVVPKRIRTKHADVEPDLKAFLVKGLRDEHT